MNSNIFAPFYPNHYRHRRIDLCHKVSATDAVFSFIQEVKQTNILLPDEVTLRDFRVRNFKEVNWVMNNMNNPNPRFLSLRNIQSKRGGQVWQRYDYTPSNLGKGYLFYFICNRCTSRVKHLYMPEGQMEYWCRNCHRLSYPTTQQKTSRNYSGEPLSGPISVVRWS